MNWVSQFLNKRKFILLLVASFLLVPAIACAQETEKVPMWPENYKTETEVEPSIVDEGPPYGTILMMQKIVGVILVKLSVVFKKPFDAIPVMIAKIK